MKHATEAQPLVAVIILNFNGYEDTIECLESLKNIVYRNYKIIVIDNGSSNNSYELIHEKFPDIKLIRSETNLGFSGGCNLGIEEAIKLNADLYLLLNNDTIVEKSFLTELVNESTKQTNAGILSPIEYSYYDKYKLTFMGGRMSLLRGPLFAPLPSKIDPSDSSPLKTSLLGGSCMLIKKELVEEIGPLDDSYFLYFEDADLCARASRVNWNLILVRKSKIWHKGSASSKDSINRALAYYLNRNLLYFVSKNYNSFFAKALFLINFYFGRIITYTKWALKWEKNLIKYSIKGIIDFHLGHMGKGKF